MAPCTWSCAMGHRSIEPYCSMAPQWLLAFGFDLRIVSSNGKIVNPLRLSFQVSRLELRC